MDALALSFRLVSLGGAFFMIATLSIPAVLTFMIFMGHAHFVLAYWYKVEKIPKLIFSPFFLLWFCLVAILAVVGIHGVLSSESWFIIASLLFITHHVYDDLALSIGTIPPLQILLLFSGIALLYLVKLAGSIFGIFATNNTLVLLSGIAICTPVFVLWRMGGRVPKLFKFYIAVTTIASVFAILAASAIAFPLVLVFFVLSHYFLWYLEYGRKVLPDTGKTKKYLFRVVLINVGLCAVWYAAQKGLYIPLYEYFFTDVFFYMWACLHILFSFIPATLGRSG